MRNKNIVRNTFGAGDGDITPAKANMNQMAKSGGLAGFMDGGGTYDGLMKAQDGKTDKPTLPPEIKYPESIKTSSDSAAYRMGLGQFKDGDGYAGITANKAYTLGLKHSKKP